jgi:hypothetical protein
MSRFANTPALTKSRQEAVTQGGVAHDHEKYAFELGLVAGTDYQVNSAATDEHAPRSCSFDSSSSGRLMLPRFRSFHFIIVTTLRMSGADRHVIGLIM